MHGHPRFEFWCKNNARMGTSVVARHDFCPSFSTSKSWCRGHKIISVMKWFMPNTFNSSAPSSHADHDHIFRTQLSAFNSGIADKICALWFCLFIRPHITSELNVNWIWNAKTWESHTHAHINVRHRDDQIDFFKHTKLPFVWPNSKLECVAHTYFGARKMENV